MTTTTDAASVRHPSATRSADSDALREAVEKLRRLSERATPGPWSWEQCGEKSDDPVVGIAYPSDDVDCQSPYAGEFQDADAYRTTIALEWPSCDGHPGNANAALTVEAVNFVRTALAASPSPADREQGVGATPKARALGVGEVERRALVIAREAVAQTKDADEAPNMARLIRAGKKDDISEMRYAYLGARAALASPPKEPVSDEVASVIECARRDIARTQTDFLGRMGQVLCQYEAVFDDHPDGDLPSDVREEAEENIVALAGLALAQFVMLRHPANPLAHLAKPDTTDLGEG